jgi:hypothetical protein
VFCFLGSATPRPAIHKYRSREPKHEKTPISRLPVTSLEFAFGLPVTSLEVQRQSHKYWHQCFFMLGHARPILLAALSNPLCTLLLLLSPPFLDYSFGSTTLLTGMTSISFHISVAWQPSQENNCFFHYVRIKLHALIRLGGSPPRRIDAVHWKQCVTWDRCYDF